MSKFLVWFLFSAVPVSLKLTELPQYGRQNFFNVLGESGTFSLLPCYRHTKHCELPSNEKL